MATKTISIDMEAYRRLKGARRGKESFSTIIKRTVRPPFDVDKYLKSLDQSPLSDTSVKAIEKQIKTRHTSSKRER